MIVKNTGRGIRVIGGIRFKPGMKILSSQDMKVLEGYNAIRYEKDSKSNKTTMLHDFHDAAEMEVVDEKAFNILNYSLNQALATVEGVHDLGNLEEMLSLEQKTNGKPRFQVIDALKEKIADLKPKEG